MTSPTNPLVDPKEYREKVFAWAEAQGLKTVRLVIIQPKVYDEPTEYQMPLAELEEFAATLHQGIDRCRRAETAIEFMPREEWDKVFLHPDPTDDVCRWCKAQPTCPAVQGKLQRAAQLDFHAIDPEAISPEHHPTLGLEEAMLVVPLMESWCKNVRAEVERRLLAGEEMNQFGLELGRQGNRKWDNPSEVQTLLREKMRIKMEHVFEMELRSPTQLETLTRPGQDEKGMVTKPVLGKRQWKQIEARIVRAEAKPSVKPKGRIKNHYVVEKPTAEGFMPIPASEADDDLSA